MCRDDLKKFSTVRGETLRLVEELNQMQAEFTPAPGKLSVSEVLDHLFLAENLYRKKISELIALQKEGQKAEIRNDSSEINTSILLVPSRLLPFPELPLRMFNFFVPSFLRERVTQYRMMSEQTPSVAKPPPGRNLGTLLADLRSSLAAAEQLLRVIPPWTIGGCSFPTYSWAKAIYSR